MAKLKPPTEEEISQTLQTALAEYNLSDQQAQQIIRALLVTSPFTSRFKGRDQGRSIINSLMTQIEALMSTTAKVSLVAVVLVLVGVFGYTQLGGNPTDYAADLDNTKTDNTETTTVVKGNGDVDEAASTILTLATVENLVLDEELSDADLINADSQALNDLGQSINNNDF